MGKEIDLLKNYPKSKRDLDERADAKTEKDREKARQFGKDFFDGDRKNGYGGFNYSPKFWEPVIPTFKNYWNLNSTSSLLDVGCAKGFMLFDFARLIPGISIKGIDISEYAIRHSKPEVRDHLQIADAQSLPFKDNSFDIVISINTVHNLDKVGCANALREIERVSRGKSFITVDAYRSDVEKDRMYKWNLTAKTIMHVDKWKSFFDTVGYSGDYFWFIP